MELLRTWTFGDRGSWWRLLAVLVALLALHGVTFSRLRRGRVTLPAAAPSPVRADGAEFRDRRLRVISVAPDGIEVERRGNRARVEVDPAGLAVGDRVAVHGTWDRAGVIRDARVVPIGPRRALRWAVLSVSAATLLALAAVLAGRYRIHPPPLMEPRRWPTR